MEFALKGSYYFDGDRKFIVKVGDYDVVTFIIDDRYISNGHRRSKNMAVHICMNQVGPGYNSIWGVGASVTIALGVLKRLGVPFDEFIEHLCKLEWDDQVPSYLLPVDASKQLGMKI